MRLEGFVKKGWGSENIWATNDKYCGKLMKFNTGAKFSIFNSSKKTIKYITFNFHGKNPVDDKVLYRAGVYNVSRKGIGPIESYEIGSWSFDNIWLTDSVDYLVLTSMVIIYMDGTSKTIPMKESLWFEDKYINNLDKLETNFKEE